MSNKSYYLEQVFPLVPDEIKARTLLNYPNIRLALQAQDGFAPLIEQNLVMLVGMTGSGKSTTLRHLQEIDSLEFSTSMLTRRDIADLFLIPIAQHLQSKPIKLVQDRIDRFKHTRYARDEFISGGTAEVFTWLYGKTDAGLTLSEGVRGTNEIQYVLKHTNWRIAELWVDPVLRLKRLSNRNEIFDHVGNPDAEDLSFLPKDQIAEIRALIDSCDITPKAIATVREETISYGNAPFDVTNQTKSYRCFVIDDLTPEQVAADIAKWIEETQ